VNPRSIKKDQLTSFHILDTKDSVSGGLRPFRDNGDFIPQETIKEGRFPNIWPSQDGDKTGFERYHTAKMSNTKVQMSK
jgi:hypothetical protein